MLRTIAAVLASGLIALPACAERVGTAAGDVEVERVADGFDMPWAIGFLPDGAFLVTEIGGRLILVDGEEKREVAGVPEVRVQGQGGLLDVAVARDYGETGEIFLTFSEPQPGGAVTALAVARLDADSPRLEDVRVIFRQGTEGGGGRHFGSRVVEAPDGTLFVTIGDRGQRDRVQDLARLNGKVVRVGRDGSVPADNPFVNDPGAAPEIWSLGHRNPQGAALDAEGRLWTVEHGPRGGDEINRPEPGLNYGWPVISYGQEYSGGRVGQGTSEPGYEQPRFYWDPSIAPSGMMIYSGRLWPEWRGQIFVGSLKFDFLSRLEIEADGSVTEVERMFADVYPRIRDVREAPDGSIWFLSEDEGAVYRMTPAPGS